MNPGHHNFFLTIFLFFSFLLSGCFYFPYIPQPPKEIKDVNEFEAYLKKLVDNGIPQGISFAVVNNDKIIYAKGFGWADRPKKISAEPETVYHWWSITKIATASAIMQLHEKGTLNIYDPVVKYLPWFNVQYPSDSSKPITIVNLLNHSSGMPDPGLDLINWIHHDEMPPVNQTNFLRQVLPYYSKLLFEPGTETRYTNTGYIVLGAIIEQASGITYEDYIRKNILNPLKMDRTDFICNGQMALNEAAGSHSIKDVLSPILYLMIPSYIRETDNNHIWFKRVYTDQTAPTALIGSVADCSRFAMVYLNDGELEGKRILNENSVVMMYSKECIKKGENFSQGLGWLVYNEEGKTMLMHEGGGPGFKTRLQLYPEDKLGFILFTNEMKTNCWEIIKLAKQINWQSYTVIK